MQKNYNIGDYVRVVKNLEENTDITVNSEMTAQQGSIHRVIGRRNRILGSNQEIDHFYYEITGSGWTWTSVMLEPIEKKDLKNY